MRQRSRRDDLAGCEWRIDLIARENIDEMTQCPLSDEDARESVIDL